MFGKIDKEFLKDIHEKLLNKNNRHYDYILAVNKETFAEIIHDFIIERNDSELKLKSLSYEEEYVVLKLGDKCSKIYFNEYIPFGQWCDMANVRTIKYPEINFKHTGLELLGGVINE